MSARIINLAEVREQRSQLEPEMNLQLVPTPDVRERFHFWCGASGQRYVHTIYSLFDCPGLPACNYVLVRRDTSGRCTALSIGRAAHEAASLNLAEIRQRGAELGASEVHVHLLAGTSKQSKLIEFDLKTGQVQPQQAASRALH